MSENAETFSANQIEAAHKFAETSIRILGTDDGYHAPTIIAASARMAGTILFRSFKFKLDSASPGQPILSEVANEEGKRLMQITWSVLSQFGVSLNGGPSAESKRSEDKPSLDFLTTQRKLEPTYVDIKDRLSLSMQEAAESAAIATAILIQQSSNLLDPHAGFGIAVYGYIEGTKTVPDPATI